MAPFLRVRSVVGRVPDDIGTVLVTSANALTGLAAATLDRERAGGIRVLAVGDATANAAKLLGFTDVHSASGDAEALVRLALLLADPASGRVVVACGRRQGHGLAAGLRAHGFAVVRRVFYRADPVARFPPEATHAIVSGDLVAALFLSAETAAAFVRLLPAGLHGALAGVRALAIGKAAADALKPLPWRDVSLARTPTLDGVLTLL